MVWLDDYVVIGEILLEGNVWFGEVWVEGNTGIGVEWLIKRIFNVVRGVIIKTFL